MHQKSRKNAVSRLSGAWEDYAAGIRTDMHNAAMKLCSDETKSRVFGKIEQKRLARILHGKGKVEPWPLWEK